MSTLFSSDVPIRPSFKSIQNTVQQKLYVFKKTHRVDNKDSQAISNVLAGEASDFETEVRKREVIIFMLINKTEAQKMISNRASI